MRENRKRRKSKRKIRKKLSFPIFSRHRKPCKAKFTQAHIRQLRSKQMKRLRRRSRPPPLRISGATTTTTTTTTYHHHYCTTTTTTTTTALLLPLPLLLLLQVLLPIHGAAGGIFWGLTTNGHLRTTSY